MLLAALGCPWGVLGRFGSVWERLGLILCCLGAVFRRLGAPWKRSWGALGTFLSPLVASWSGLGVVLGRLGRSWHVPGPSWNHFCTLFWPSGGPQKPLKNHWFSLLFSMEGASRSYLGSFFGHLPSSWCVFLRLGASLGHSWRHFGRLGTSWGRLGASWRRLDLVLEPKGV